MGDFKIFHIDPFKGKKIEKCVAETAHGDGCLENDPPPKKEMICGHMCGAGRERFGYCAAVFANRLEEPELFEDPI